MRKRATLWGAIVVGMGALASPAAAQDSQVFDDIMGIYGTSAYFGALMDHCFDIGGSEQAYKDAFADWQKRNQPYREQADAVLAKIGGDKDGIRKQTEEHAASDLMSSAEAQANPLRYCQTARANLNGGQFDLPQIYTDALARIKARDAS